MNTSAFNPVSYEITGHIPSRQLDAEDKANAGEWFGKVRIVHFPRGFETFQVAVFGEGLTLEDCIEAALDFLRDESPESLAEGDETTVFAGKPFDAGNYSFA